MIDWLLLSDSSDMPVVMLQLKTHHCLAPVTVIETPSPEVHLKAPSSDIAGMLFP